jgi:lysozyme
MSVRGIDVSDVQGEIDWRTVADSDLAYAVTQATDGITSVANTFGTNWKAIAEVGLVRGASHLFRPEIDAQAQAERFLSVVSLEPGDLPPVAIVQTHSQVDVDTLVTRLQTWLSFIERKTQRQPILYTTLSFWQSLGPVAQFAQYPLWIVDRLIASSPTLPVGWQDWLLWQYTDRGEIKGINPGVNISWFNSMSEGAYRTGVKVLQRHLAARGANPGAIDARYSIFTQAAVMTFQQAVGATVDGVVGPQTWAHLVDRSSSIPTALASTSTQAALTAPTTSISQTTSPSIQLVEVGRFYQALPQQTQALNWLQAQVAPETLAEFARLWRNQTQPSSTPIQLVNAIVYYQGSAHQQQALNWLQQQIPPATIEEFARQWRSVPPATISLIEVARYYRGIPAQEQAIEALQRQLSAATLSEFARQWRNQAAVTTTPIRLVDAIAYYKASSHQTQALTWLQRQIPATVLSEFARQWQTASVLPLRLVNVMEFYGDLPHQKDALVWLQAQLSQKTLEEFSRQWRG